jgi:putative endopeptidase
VKDAKNLIVGLCLLAAGNLLAQSTPDANPPKVPQFSVDYMDRLVSPATNFYLYADGTWLKNNPVPPDKSRWASFSELNERNIWLIHQILVAAADDKSAPVGSPVREVGDFYASAMDTNLIEELRFKPIQGDLDKIAGLKSKTELLAYIASQHRLGEGMLFGSGVGPDDKDSTTYTFGVRQGGLSLPDRDYYLKDSFASQRTAYREHITKMFTLLGEPADQAAADAGTVITLETELAEVSRSRVDLRDPDKNYNKLTVVELTARDPDLGWPDYLAGRGVPNVTNVVVGQPEFFDALDKLIQTNSLADWQTYLRWHLLHGAAGALHHEVEEENFNFFGRILTGQPQQEARWKRAGRAVDGNLGEALGQLYVEKYFPAAARARMTELVDNLKVVYRDHLARAPWMTPPTRAKALEKFARFTQKIGYPEKFRDYSSVRIDRDDYYGNEQRLSAFEENRQTVRVGQKVDRTEWGMTPPTINAYYNPSMNEIVFPAGILQPPFFDASMDEAVNYGAIGVVIGHEITHGYDDEGRKYDGDGNLNDWWSPADIKQFEERTQKVVDEYNAFEPLPGLHVNGKLTLGENLADIGGISIAYDALELYLARNPAERKIIDGFTPEQRFFISFSQIWRTNAREAEVRRLVTVDPHSPGQFRAVGPLMNFQSFYDAFGIKPGAPMWRAPELRAKIW